MKNEEKKMILILIVVSVIIVFVIKNITGNKNVEVENEVENEVVNEFVEILEDGTKLNVSDKLHETKVVNGIEFSNIQLTNKNGQSLLITDITNKTSTIVEEQFVEVVIYDKNLRELTTAKGYLTQIKPGETMQFSVSLQIDYTNAYDFEIKIK